MSRNAVEMTSPGLEIRRTNQSAPSVGGESTHSMASTALVDKDLEGMPIAQKVGPKKFIFLAWEGNEITKEEAEQIAGGNIWYQDEQDPTKGRVRRRGQFAREDDARSHLSASRAGCSNDIANLDDLVGESGLQDVPEESCEDDESEQCEDDDREQCSQESGSFSTLWCILILLIIFIGTIALPDPPQDGLLKSLGPDESSASEHRVSSSCVTGDVECKKEPKWQSITDRTGGTTMSQPLLNLLASDETDSKEHDIVRMLAGPFQQSGEAENIRRMLALPVEKLKIMAKTEIDRILASKKIGEILGDGSENAFHRIVHLIHPDKGLVSHDDLRANQALRLVFAARRATSQSD